MKIEDHPIIGEIYKASLSVEACGSTTAVARALESIGKATSSARALVCEALMLREALRGMLVYVSGRGTEYECLVETLKEVDAKDDPARALALVMATLAIRETAHLDS